MKHALWITAAGAAIVGAPAAAEAATFRAELGYERASFSDDDIDLDFNAITARAGIDFNASIGAEVEGAMGLGEETVEVEEFEIDVKLDHLLAAYAVGSIPLNDQVELFARAGYATAEVSADAGFIDVSDSGDGLALGVGARFFIGGGKNGVRVDYTRYDLEDVEVDALGVAYVRRF